MKQIIFRCTLTAGKVTDDSTSVLSENITLESSDDH